MTGQNRSVWLCTVRYTATDRTRVDEQMQLAVRKRLGMLPAMTLATDSCLSCHGRNTVKEPRFIDDPDHFHACIGKTPAGSSVTTRHNRLVDVLGGLARSVGYTVIREPPFEDIAVIASEVDPHTGESFEAETIQRDELRGDLLLIRGDERLLIDVTIVAERAKHAKYDAACELRRWKMTAFADAFFSSSGSTSCDADWKSSG